MKICDRRKREREIHGFLTKSFGRTSSFLSSTSSELRSSNLRIVELSSAMRLWFLLRS